MRFYTLTKDIVIWMGFVDCRYNIMYHLKFFVLFYTEIIESIFEFLDRVLIGAIFSTKLQNQIKKLNDTREQLINSCVKCICKPHNPKLFYHGSDLVKKKKKKKKKKGGDLYGVTMSCKLGFIFVRITCIMLSSNLNLFLLCFSHL